MSDPVVQTQDGPRSACCNAEIEVSRPVSDVVAYFPREYQDGVLGVDYGKVYEGEAGEYSAICGKCGKDLEVEVEEW